MPRCAVSCTTLAELVGNAASLRSEGTKVNCKLGLSKLKTFGPPMVQGKSAFRK